MTASYGPNGLGKAGGGTVPFMITGAQKAEVTGSNPVGRANLLNNLAQDWRSHACHTSAECPRNGSGAGGAERLSGGSISPTPAPE